VTPRQDERFTFTFVTDGAESAVAQAAAVAGDKAVTVVGGVAVVHQLLEAGLVDERHLDVMPVILGAGLRFLDNVAAGLRLEKIDFRERRLFVVADEGDELGDEVLAGGKLPLRMTLRCRIEKNSSG